MDEVDYLLFDEYLLLMKAQQLKEVDKEYYIHRQAWANQQVQATEKRGKRTVPVYGTFKKFFDYEKQEKLILKPKPKKKEKSKLELLMLQANS